jgi:hypothetical protein
MLYECQETDREACNPSRHIISTAGVTGVMDITDGAIGVGVACVVDVACIVGVASVVGVACVACVACIAGIASVTCFTSVERPIVKASPCRDYNSANRP